MSAPNITLWWGSGSPFARKVQIALYEKQLPFVSKLISFNNKDHKAPEYLVMHPRGQVPVLTDGDIVLYESDAIIYYLEETYPDTPLLPSDKKERALALVRWREAENIVKNFDKAGFLPFFVSQKNVKDHQEEWEKAVSTMKEEWKLWDKHLEGKQYLAGSQFSVADIAVYVLFALLARIGKDWSKDTEFPNLARWYKLIDEREASQKAYPPHWKETKGAQCF